MGDITGVLALAAEAGQLAGTLCIHSTALRLGRDQVTSDSRVATETNRAAALGTMVVHAALGSNAAVAGILAALVAAGQMEGALVVRAALGTFATHQGIATISFRTVAPGTVVEVRPADGSRAALGEATRIHALLVDAGLRGGALAVRSAAQKVAVLQGVAGVSLVADAQRSVELDVAAGLWGAQVRLLAGISAHLVDAGLVVGAVPVADALRLGGWISGICLRHSA